MNSEWSCEMCNKKYKTYNGYKNHKCKNKRNDLIPKEKNGEAESKITKKRRKKKISPQVRFDVWKKYIGKEIESKCFCCWKNRITPFTYCNTFHAGHIISEANGGIITIGNLLPICSDCNSSMGTINWDEYIDKYTNFRIRIYGDNISDKAIKNIIKIQKYYKNNKNKINKKKIIKKKINKKKIIKKKRIPNYLKTTKSFLRKISIKYVKN